MSLPVTITITVTVNGEAMTRAVEPRLNLVDFLRAEGLTGTHVGCEHGVCGACTVQVEGRTARGCLMLAVQCDGLEVRTIEDSAGKGVIKELQDAFIENNALQCGFCTPGILLTMEEFLRDNPTPSRDEIRESLSGNYCRCTGYQSIVDAVEQVAGPRAGEAR